MRIIIICVIIIIILLLTYFWYLYQMTPTYNNEERFIIGRKNEQLCEETSFILFHNILHGARIITIAKTKHIPLQNHQLNK